MQSIFHTTIVAFSLGFALAGQALAQDHSGHSGHGTPSTSTQPVDRARQDAVMTAGEITRVDSRNGKLTIRHEEIKNLDMPPMTMVFGLRDSTQAAHYKPGDKVRFHVEDDKDTLTITRIEMAQ